MDLDKVLSQLPTGGNWDKVPGSTEAPRFAAPDKGGEKIFHMVNRTQEAEDKINLQEMRVTAIERPTGTLTTTLHLIKGALGSGILSGHVAYRNAGWLVALIANFCLGIYMTLCLFSLIDCAHKLCRRTGRPFLSYPDLGECALKLCPSRKLRKFSKCFRYFIDLGICLELFGACSTYQLIIAKTIKQLVENQQRASIPAQIPGYPNLRIYVLCIILPCVLLCLLRHLKWLAPFSFVANGLVFLCVVVTIYYSMTTNAGFKDLIPAKDFSGFFSLVGMIVFSMSCSSQIMTIENNMRNPGKLKLALSCAMLFIVFGVATASFFGYNAYREESDAPITVNFPMELFPKILKVCIAIMIVITHALNFFIPFTCVWVYIKKRVNPARANCWEYFFRALFVIIIGIIATIFPSVNLLMGFLGCFCLSNIAFIWPQVIEMLVYWERPGYGFCKWRLLKCILFSCVGMFIMIAGTIVHAKDLPLLFK